MVCCWFACVVGGGGSLQHHVGAEIAAAASHAFDWLQLHRAGGVGGCGSLLRRPFGVVLLLRCWICCVARGWWIAADGGGSLIRCEGKAINNGCWLSAESAVRG